MAERKVIFDRIVGVELAQGRGDFFGRRPGGSPPFGQPEVATDSMDMGVDWDHEFGGRNRPEPQVHAVSRANHPSRVQDESLARTPRARIADQMPQTATRRIAAQCVGKLGQPLSKISVASVMEVNESPTQGAVLTK